MYPTLYYMCELKKNICKRVLTGLVKMWLFESIDMQNKINFKFHNSRQSTETSLATVTVSELSLTSPIYKEVSSIKTTQSHKRNTCVQRLRHLPLKCHHSWTQALFPPNIFHRRMSVFHPMISEQRNLAAFQTWLRYCSRLMCAILKISPNGACVWLTPLTGVFGGKIAVGRWITFRYLQIIPGWNFPGGSQTYGGKIPAVYNYNDQSGESSHYQSYHIRKFVAGVILLPVPRKVEAPTFMKWNRRQVAATRRVDRSLCLYGSGD